jgi:hypothetical protein
MATNTKPFASDIRTNQTEGESIKDLVRRHLTDESHTTTDEELKNVKLSIYNYEEIKEVLSI